MNIGYAAIYPVRGSIHNMIYISKTLEREGHKSYFLECASSVPSCYRVELSTRPKILKCAECLLGGVRSFGVKNITTMKHSAVLSIKEPLLHAKKIVASTAYSLNRIETEDQKTDADVLSTIDRLSESAVIAYSSAKNWIKDNSIEIVFIFNGRLDLPNAVVQACKDSNIPFITFEAAYPGVALEVNDDCRSLRSIHSICEEYKNRALTKEQADFAGKIVGQMFTKTNLVWRLYNTSAKSVDWHTKNNSTKVLIVPSSTHEFMDAEHWKTGWKHFTDGITEVLHYIDHPNLDVIVRCHPHWGETIGDSVDGSKSEKFYKRWSKNNGYKIITSDSIVSTQDLISQADLVIVQFGTAGIEAALLGKKVIALSPSFYSNSDFALIIPNHDSLPKLDQLEKHDPILTARKALRYIYNYHKRFCQLTEYINPKTVFDNIYSDVQSLDYLLQNAVKGILAPDDKQSSMSEHDEDSILDMIHDHRFLELAALGNKEKDNGTPIRRTHFYRWIDSLRPYFRAGDR